MLDFLGKYRGNTFWSNRMSLSFDGPFIIGGIRTSGITVDPQQKLPQDIENLLKQYYQLSQPDGYLTLSPIPGENWTWPSVRLCLAVDNFVNKHPYYKPQSGECTQAWYLDEQQLIRDELNRITEREAEWQTVANKDAALVCDSVNEADSIIAFLSYYGIYNLARKRQAETNKPTVYLSQPKIEDLIDLPTISKGIPSYRECFGDILQKLWEISPTKYTCAKTTTALVLLGAMYIAYRVAPVDEASQQLTLPSP
jgi:hypothetical protein